MSKRGWVYVWTILTLGVSLSVISFRTVVTANEVAAFFVLTLLATLAQSFRVEAPTHQSYYATYVFLFAGVILLSPSLLVLVIVVSHTIQWIAERIKKSDQLKNWYLQPFNMSVELIAGLAAYWILQLVPGVDFPDSVSAILVILAACVYVLLNHTIVGFALVLARNVPLRESGILDRDNLLTDLVLLLLGGVVAGLWVVNPWLIPLALAPMFLIYRALEVPLLKNEANTDGKTGLNNPRHFQQLFEAELNRAARFSRPLVFVMGDLDLLRNINNTYGHLAGDEVLVTVGKVIRESIRDYDIAGRFGGEEFSIVMPETTRAEGEALAERIRQQIENTLFSITTSPEPIHVTMSLGLAAFPEDAQKAQNLVHAADLAVYQAKLHGRNQTVVAASVPHSLELDQAPTAGSIEPAAHKSQEDWEVVHPNTREVAPTPASPVPLAQQDRRPKRGILRLFIANVILLGLMITGFGLAYSIPPDQMAMVALGLFTLISEIFNVKMYGDNTISVSVLLLFAAGLIAGVPGVAIISTLIAGVHYIVERPAFYKTLFNWAVHVIAGTLPALLGFFVPLVVDADHVILLMILTVPTALALYLVESGLFAIVIGLDQNTPIIPTWRGRFSWLWVHYLTLCLVALFLAVGYQMLGASAVLLFAVPALMMRYSQQQYVGRTEASVRELTRLNKELEHANSEIHHANDAIHELNDELFTMLARAMDARDPFVSGHAGQVSRYALAIGQQLKFPASRLEQLRQAALLHDIGKLAIKEQILHKPSRLTMEEYEYVKKHAVLGASLLENSSGLRHLAPFIRHHHEAWNGKGYPDQLAGEQIPLEARILAVCDAVEAMASDRPYQRAMPVKMIVAEVQRCAGEQFDPTVVAAFLQVVNREGQTLIVNSTRIVAEKQSERTNSTAQNRPPNVSAFIAPV